MSKRLREQSNFQNILEASNKTHGMQLLKQSEDTINLLIMDTNICDSESNLLVFIKEIRSEFPELKLLLLSFSESGASIYKYRDAGVHGYLLKSGNASELLQAIKVVRKGKSYYEGLVELLLEHYLQHLNASKSSPLQLTPIEMAFVQELAAKDYSLISSNNKFINSSIEEIVWQNIQYKLGTTDASEILDVCYMHGWLP